jgi:hypothetical protein|tara:strand:+ start:36 stop:599 length:564 start_codon:yes stop_codon:yes gene_type:complete
MTVKKKPYGNEVRNANWVGSGVNLASGGTKKKDKKTGAKFTTDDLNISADIKYKGLGLGGTFTQSKSDYSPTDKIKEEFRNKYIQLRGEVPVNKNISLYGQAEREKRKFKFNAPFYQTSESSKPQYGYTVGATYRNPDSGIEGYIEGSNRPGQPSTGRKRKLGAKAGLKLRFNKGGSIRGRKASYGR